jgi:hypothetical protein
MDEEQTSFPRIYADNRGLKQKKIRDNPRESAEEK